MKQQSKRMLLFIVGIFFIVIWIVRFSYLNIAWPNPTVYAVPMKESVEVNGIEYRILEAKIGTVENSLKFYNPMLEANEVEEIKESLKPLPEDRQGHYLMGIKVEITNHTSQELSIGDCIFLPIYQSSWNNGPSAYIFPYINVEYQKTIKPEDTQSYIVPYNLYEEMFSAKRWKIVGDSTFKLILQYYPQKIELDCTVENINTQAV